MKKFVLMGCIMAFGSAFSQTQYAITTTGKKVILKADKTWEYAEGEKAPAAAPVKTCTLDKNYKEPEFSKNFIIQAKGGTVEDLKKFISINNSIPVEKIKVLDLSESIGNGVYLLCVDGVEQRYYRTDSVFHTDLPK